MLMGFGIFHGRKHGIDKAIDHVGVPSAVVNELMKFDANGLPAVSELKHVKVTRAVPNTGFDYIEIGKFTQAQGSFALLISVASEDASALLSGADLYYIVGKYDETLAAWQLAYPLQTIEPHSQLCVMIDDDELHLRLIAITSTPSPVTVNVHMIELGVGDAVFTAASGTGTMGLPGTNFASTLISQVAGKIQTHAEMSMNTEKITDVVDPGAAQDVATKNYHDTTPCPPSIHGISDNTKHSGALVNDNIALGDGNGLVKDSGVAISSIVGGLIYQGTWNANTNTPTLADGTGTKGHYYRVSVAGSQDLGSGSITFAVEDFVAHNGTIWQKIDHTDQVTSVFTRQGAVVAAASDYDASQIDNDSGVAGAFVDDALDQLDTDKVEQSDVDTSISTHAGLPSVHHAKYLDSEAVAAFLAYLDSQYVESEAPQNETGGSYVLKTGASLQWTPPIAGDYIVEYSAEITNSSSSAECRAIIELDNGGTPGSGTELGFCAHEPETGDQYHMISGMKKLTLTQAAHRIDWAFLEIGGGTARMRRARITVRRVA